MERPAPIEPPSDWPIVFLLAAAIISATFAVQLSYRDFVAPVERPPLLALAPLPPIYADIYRQGEGRPRVALKADGLKVADEPLVHGMFIYEQSGGGNNYAIHSGIGRVLDPVEAAAAWERIDASLKASDSSCAEEPIVFINGIRVPVRCLGNGLFSTAK